MIFHYMQVLSRDTTSALCVPWLIWRCIGFMDITSVIPSVDLKYVYDLVMLTYTKVNSLVNGNSAYIGC